MSGQIRVLIVEDHQLLAEGLALALGRHADLQVVGAAGTVAEGTRLALETRPDVILLDYHLPDGRGTQVASVIRQQLPRTAIVVVTGETGEAALLDAVVAGACGFLLKAQTTTEVVTAVRRAAEGEMLIPAATLAALVGQQREQAQQESERAAWRGRLTPREQAVLRLMAQGLDTRAIAARLVVSPTTVRTYSQNVLEKLGAHSRLEAVARASHYGLLEQPPR